MIFFILLSACALSVWGTPCAREDCEDLELLTVKSQKPELERPGGRPFHRGDEDDLNYLVFPVQGDFAWNIINRKRHKVTVSARGGGTRAMAGTIGQLRALKDMNLLDEVDQILANSGSTWSTAVYLFADKSYSSEDLLGASTFGKLANLTLDAIRTPHGELIKSANESFDTYLTAALAAAEAGLVSFSKAFEAAVGGAYFCRFGLNGELPQWPFPFSALRLCTNANKNQIYVESETQLKIIKLRNPKLNVSDALIKQRTKVDSFVMQACMLSPFGYEPIGDSIVAVRFSPDFSGFPYFADEKAVTFKPLNTTKFGSLPTLENVLVGGGVVESFAFMRVEEPEREPRIVRPYKASSAALDVGPVSLSQASAYSSAVFSLLGLTSFDLLDNLTFNKLTPALKADPFFLTPRRPTWPVALERQGDDKQRDFYLGDGGLLDNGGLPEAIRSGAKCSILLLNNIRPIDVSVDWCNVSDAVKQDPSILLGPPALGFPERDGPLYDYFGIFLQLPGGATLKTIGFDFSNNQLFETHLIFDLFCEATTLTAQGKPAVVHKNYTTMENKHWGIKAGTEVDVLFVFTQISQDWLDQLDPATKDAILNGDFNTKGSVNGFPWRFSFPHLSTNQPQGEGAQSTAIGIEQANLYASLTEYSLRVNEPKLRQCMGL